MGAVADHPIARRRELPISEYLPYANHVSDTVIVTTEGDLLSVWEIVGRSFMGVDAAELDARALAVHQLLMAVADERLVLASYVLHEPAARPVPTEFDSAFARVTDARYCEALPTLWTNRQYLVMVYRLQPDLGGRLLSRLETPRLTETLSQRRRALEAFEQIHALAAETLAPYGARLLSAVQRGRYAYSEPAEFLARLLNGYDTQVPITASRLSHTIADARPIIGPWGEVGERREAGIGKRYLSMVELADFTADTAEPGRFDWVLGFEFECVLVQSFVPIGLQAARKQLRKHVQWLEGSRDASQKAVDDTVAAIEAVNAREIVMGEHHATLLIMADSDEARRAAVGRAKNAFMVAGFKPAVLDWGLEAAYWAQMPGNWDLRTRPMPITSVNFVDFASMHTHRAGRAHNNPWGPAVALLRTRAGTPLHFSFHADEIAEEGDQAPGHFAIFGQTGSGKTVMLAFLALVQASRFGPVVVAFDKDRGMQPAILACGGRYLALAIGKPSGFNPCARPDTPAERLFIARLVAILVGGASHRDEREIAQAVEGLMGLPPASRRLSTLAQFLPDPHTEHDAAPTVRARLDKWLEGGPNGWLFDNPTDQLDFDSARIFGFDLTEFLPVPELRAPTLAYLIHRTAPLAGDDIRKRPFIRIFEEAWKAFEDPALLALAIDDAKTLRKKDGVLAFVAQDPDDVQKTPAAGPLIKSCATMLLGYNPLGTRAEYVDYLGLTEAQFALMRTLGPREFLLRQGSESEVVRLDLSHDPQALAVLSGNPGRGRLAEALAAEHGPDFGVWGDLYVEGAKRHRSPQ